MAALTVSSSMHASSSGPTNLHQSIEQLVNISQQRTNLETHREAFQSRALRDVTTNSNDTAMMMDPSNPTLVKEEMEAQKDYFRKLKFTYLEQEAKRNFLFSITGDEPQGVLPGENEEREKINAQKKAALKVTKAEVDDMRAMAIKLAKENTTKHNALSPQLIEAQALGKEIRDMELELARIKATHPPEDRLTITQANEILDQQTVEIERLTEAIGTTSSRTDVVHEGVARGRKEVQKLEREREREEARAKEIREGREAGDTKVDEMCQWLSSSISFYRFLLGIRSVTATSSNKLLLQYDIPSKARGASKEVGLELEFDTGTRRLADAQLVGSEMDIGEVVGLAVATNDVAGLIADVLVRLRPAE